MYVNTMFLTISMLSLVYFLYLADIINGHLSDYTETQLFYKLSIFYLKRRKTKDKLFYELF